MKIAMLFPGYGSQFVGMAKELYDQHRVIQELFEEASNCLGINFVKLCFASSDIELSKIEHAYPAIFLVSCAIYNLCKQEGVVPELVAGYNQGEWSALYAAGSITFPDGLYLLSKYAHFYQQILDAHELRLAKVSGVPYDPLVEMCDQIETNVPLSVAIQNTAFENVITGSPEGIDLLREKVNELRDAYVEEVPLEYGVHSVQAASIVQQFKPYLGKVDFKDVHIPFINNHDAQIIVDGGAVKEHVVQQLQASVQWHRVMSCLHEYDLLVEIGPGKQLKTWAKEKYPDKISISINKQVDIDELKQICSI